MRIAIEWGYLVAGAFAVSGIIEWVKGFFKTPLPSWVWRTFLPFACFGVAWAADGGIFQTLTNAMILWALSQFCKTLIVDTVTAVIQKITSTVPAKPPAPPIPPAAPPV
jgi:hypothetical protein